jgi:hypothetical protein
MIISITSWEREVFSNELESFWQEQRTRIPDAEYELLTREIDSHLNECIRFDYREFRKDPPTTPFIQHFYERNLIESVRGRSLFLWCAVWHVADGRADKWFEVFDQAVIRAEGTKAGLAVAASFVSVEKFHKLTKLSPEFASGIDGAIKSLVEKFEREIIKSAEYSHEYIGPSNNAGKVADLLIRAVNDLASESTVPKALDAWRDLLSDLIDNDDPAGSVNRVAGFAAWLQRHVMLDMAKGIPVMLNAGVARFQKLLAMTKPLNPSKPAAHFLARVSKCYIFGFDNECIAMCRGAIDREFESEIAYDDCLNSFADAPGVRYFTLADRIAAAVKCRRINEEIAEAARRVKEAGKKAVHTWPQNAPDAISIIRDTMSVLQAFHE